jgi:pSer/pThr/pTyr-binding forkhead associated (FHA) protein
MSDVDEHFFEACGGAGPLAFEWRLPESKEVVRTAIAKPSLIIGRSKRADVVVGHPSVGIRHALVQLVGGRVFVIDLESRDGLRWGGVPRNYGWIDRRRPFRVGEVEFRLIEGDVGWAATAEPNPTSARYRGPEPLPETFLEIRRPGESVARSPMNRAVVLVGGSDRCQLRLKSEGASRFVCALVRTPSGVWAVDLLSTKGYLVNGVRGQTDAMGDGDAISVGEERVRVLYGRGGRSGPAGAALESTGLAGAPAKLGCAVAGPVALRPVATPIVGGAVRDDLRPVLEHAMTELGGGVAPSSAFGQALMMMVQLLGEVHRDHLSMVRDELAQLRRLGAEIDELRVSLESGKKPALSGLSRHPGYDAPPEPPGRNGTHRLRDDESELSPWDSDSFAPRPDPAAARLLVGERLAAWEQEHQSRLQRVLELLVKR